MTLPALAALGGVLALTEAAGGSAAGMLWCWLVAAVVVGGPGWLIVRLAGGSESPRCCGGRRRLSLGLRSSRRARWRAVWRAARWCAAGDRVGLGSGDRRCGGAPRRGKAPCGRPAAAAGGGAAPLRAARAGERCGGGAVCASRSGGADLPQSGLFLEPRQRRELSARLSAAGSAVFRGHSDLPLSDRALCRRPRDGRRAAGL